MSPSPSSAGCFTAQKAHCEPASKLACHEEEILEGGKRKQVKGVDSSDNKPAVMKGLGSDDGQWCMKPATRWLASTACYDYFLSIREAE